MNKQQEPIRFKRDGYDFIIKKYKKVGDKLKGMNEAKVFVDNGKHYKNHGVDLTEVLDFQIFKDGKEIAVKDYAFDTKTRVAGVIIYDEKVLLIYREKEGRKYYVYPGGHLKTGETPEEGMKREILEETNLNIYDKEVKELVEVHAEGFALEKYYLVKLAKLNSQVFDTNPEDSKEVSDLIWVSLSDAKNLEHLYPREIISQIV